jgi:hypothetical protein
MAREKLSKERKQYTKDAKKASKRHNKSEKVAAAKAAGAAASQYGAANAAGDLFDVNKYNIDGPPGGFTKFPIAPYNDGADALANRQKMVISFQHEASNESVFFKAFITALNETYNSDWVSEHVFGRVDPIKIFRSTERKITLAFKVPAASESEAYENLEKLQTLTQILYPVYTSMDGQDAQLMGQAPLVRLKVMNIIQKNNAPASDAATNFNFDSYQTCSGANHGILGAINNIQINHNLENPEASAIGKGPNTVLPTYIDVSVDFSPIHEHPVGWDEKGNSLTSTFPYGISKGTTAADQRKKMAEEAANAEALGWEKKDKARDDKRAAKAAAKEARKDARAQNQAARALGDRGGRMTAEDMLRDVDDTTDTVDPDIFDLD